MEKGQDQNLELAVDDHHNEVQRDVGAGDFRHSELGDDAMRPSTPALQITMRHSFDQSSERLEGSPVEPGEWLSDGGSKRSSPRRRHGS